jgi:hypothetical protein
MLEDGSHAARVNRVASGSRVWRIGQAMRVFVLAMCLALASCGAEHIPLCGFPDQRPPPSGACYVCDSDMDTCMLMDFGGSNAASP